MNYTDFLDTKNIEYRLNEPMCRHTTFRIGGEASYYVLPKTEEEFISAFESAYESEMPVFVCGNLSNIVFADEGFDGAVIDTRMMNSLLVEGNLILAQAGATLTSVSRLALERGLTGLEFSYGIPGTVGGGVFMNAGAYGGQLSDVTVKVRAYDIASKRIVELNREECEFSYRHSIFSEGNMLILSAVFSLESGERESIRILMNERMQARRDMQPLELPSAGSVFKRPEGYFVGKMMDDLGLKGLRVGGIEVSRKHGGFMVNVDNGTCADLIALISTVKERVYAAYGVTLECEIGFVR